MDKEMRHEQESESDRNMATREQCDARERFLQAKCD